MALDLARGLLLLVHLGASAAWLGAMLYSLVVVRPRVREFFADPDEREDFVVALATDARWKVLGLAAALALSGAGLIGVAVAEADDPGARWIVLVLVKAALLAASVALFAYLSWRLWPARFLAHVGGLPSLDAVRRRFDRLALVLAASVAANFVLGVAAAVAR